MNNARVWEILLHLLRGGGSSTETAVRLTAASALRVCIDVSVSWVLVAEPWDANSVSLGPLI